MTCSTQCTDSHWEILQAVDPDTTPTIHSRTHNHMANKGAESDQWSLDEPTPFKVNLPTEVADILCA